ncbi:MAG: methylenetetrahydrofolate reductase [Rhodospirillales bacterium]
MRYSVEIFPPKDGDVRKLAIPFLSAGASHISLTYGAGGSSRGRSREAALTLAIGGVPTAAHITIAGQTREEVDNTLAMWINTGIRRFVALRGDGDGPGLPFTPHSDGYQSSVELIERIHGLGASQIAVAAYPNRHPDDQGGDSDLDYLKRKIDAGATEVITQFFFEAEAYLRFRDRYVAAGLDAPLVPGILPVFNVVKVASFAKKCGEPLPRWLISRFAGLDANPEMRQQIAVATAGRLIDRLRSEGLDRVHLYSCNDAELTLAVCRLLAFPEEAGKAAA